MYKIRLQVVRTANDDGSEAATVTPAGVTALVDIANQIYAAADVLLMPRDAAAAIDAAGGLPHWQPTAEELADPEFRVWHWLRTPPADLPLFYGYGREDRFAPGMAKLAAALPEAAIRTRPGGHDWPVWSALWADFLAGPWLS